LPSLRSSIRQRLEAEEAAQQQDNPVEAEETNPVEEAAGAALQAKLDEQPDPVEQKPQDESDDDYNAELDDDVHALELQLADAQAQVAGHKRGSRGYADAVASRLRTEEPRERRERSISMAMPVSRESPSWSSGRTTPARTELTGEEIAFCCEQNYDLEEYRKNKTKMNALKASGVIQQ
jgi:hypothetical protein